MLKFMVNNVQDMSAGNGHKWTAEQKFDYHKALPWGDDLMLTAKGLWNGARDDGTSQYRLRYAYGEMPDDIQDRLTRNKIQFIRLEFRCQLCYSFLDGLAPEFFFGP